MQSGRITEVISTLSTNLEEQPSTDETTGINNVIDHSTTTTRVFYDDGEETGPEIRNPTGESINNLRMREITFIDNSIQRLKEELEYMENDTYGDFTMDDIIYTERRIKDLIEKKNEISRSISAEPLSS
jgi:hypothetical protein